MWYCCNGTVQNNQDTSYEKRVSWVEYPAAPRKAVYEYKGKCPPPRPHGRVTAGNPGNYIRMLPGKMAKMKKKKLLGQRDRQKSTIWKTRLRVQGTSDKQETRQPTGQLARIQTTLLTRSIKSNRCSTPASSYSKSSNEQIEFHS